MVDFETSRSKLGLEIKFVENEFFLENYTSLQREPFLIMFYTTNLSPLLVTK